MSRLTRKRKFPTPYDDRKPPRSEQITHDETSTSTHDKRIFQRAVLSANKHGINLEPGRENNGYATVVMKQQYLTLTTENVLLKNFP